jgi:hypothetical protein
MGFADLLADGDDDSLPTHHRSKPQGECNQHKHGNLIEYGIRIERRIGKNAVQELHSLRNDRLSLPLDKIKEAIYYYKDKVKEIKK